MCVEGVVGVTTTDHLFFKCPICLSEWQNKKLACECYEASQINRIFMNVLRPMHWVWLIEKHYDDTLEALDPIFIVDFNLRTTDYANTINPACKEKCIEITTESDSLVLSNRYAILKQLDAYTALELYNLIPVISNKNTIELVKKKGYDKLLIELYKAYNDKLMDKLKSTPMKDLVEAFYTQNKKENPFESE